MTIALRPFQADLVHRVYQAWQSGARGVMPVAATGSGKTVVLSHVLQDEPGASVAIAHRQELVSQISVALARNGVRHRLVGAKKGSPLVRVISALQVAELGCSYFDPNAKTGVGGVDTIIRMDPQDPWFKQVRLGVQDEAHHVLRDNKWGKAALMYPSARWLLPTATPLRADGKGLGTEADGLVDAMILAPTMREIINMGYLTDYRIFAPPNNFHREQIEVSDATGEFKPDSARKEVKRAQITGDVVAHYLKIARGKLGVTFAVDVDAATEIAQAFRDAGVPAEVVSAKTPDALRVQILQRFKRREILQLVNVDLFGEGFDLPTIEVVSFARPTESFALYSQQFGRALRLMLSAAAAAVHMQLTDEGRRAAIAASDKPVALIIDHVGNVIRHGLPDAARDWTTGLARRERRGSSKSDAIPLRVCIPWTDPLGVRYEGCGQPFERVHKACPYCACPVPPPAARSGPEYVDGDLLELDPSALAAMRGEIARIDAPPTIPYGAAPEVAGAIKKRHWQRQQAVGRLRNVIAWWAGVESAQGRGESESYRRFYFRYGLDVGSAQTLPAKEADELAARVAADLAKLGIDATVDATAYFSVRG